MPIGAVLSCLKRDPFKHLPCPRALWVAGARPGSQGTAAPRTNQGEPRCGVQGGPDRLLAHCFTEEAGNNQVTAP